MAVRRSALAAAASLVAGAIFPGCGPSFAEAEIIPGVLERAVLTPGSPYHITVGVGQAKFLGFSCLGGPADVVISLSTYAERADPLLFLSMNPELQPSFQRHDASSFGQWREDASGDHYVTAKGVSPRGGILGLVNLRHFSGEELDGILSIHCTFIIAFDTLFWDHLRNAAVCPVGINMEDEGPHAPASFCSGRGRCMKGECECHGDFIGPACEHSKTDVVVAADGHYRFQVATGRYQYFRIRIPPRFPGGFLEVKLMAQSPLVVLIRTDDLPTKTNFELSNFDDWINKRYISDLKLKVPPSEDIMMGPGMLPSPVPGGFPGLPPMNGPPMNGPPMEGGPPPMPGLPPMPPMSGGRRLMESLRGASETMGGIDSWTEFFARAQDFRDGLDAIPELPLNTRRLQQDGPPSAPWKAQCPTYLEPTNNPACKTPAFQECQSSCQRCMGCVKGGRGGMGDRGCSEACDACVSVGCITALAACAEDMSCMDSAALQCEAGCGSCMSCFDSNDDKCSGCSCCISCLPLAAKCSIGQAAPAQVNRFAFVGVYNHRRFYKDKEVVHAAADISLTADPDYAREELPPSWIAELYDQFHDIRSLEITQQEFYPNGDQYIYDLAPKDEDQTLEVKLYRDRLTLIHIDGLAGTKFVHFRFVGGPEITHILSSSAAAPKTFFDFDQMHEKRNGEIHVDTLASDTVWVALFGAEDGYTQTTIGLAMLPQQTPAIGFALVTVFGFLCALLVLGIIYGGAQKLGEFMGMDPNIPLMERLGCLVRNVNPHESTASLTRTGSLTGFIGSDVIDRSVEDQYLHRGGTGDDGI